MTDRNNPQNSIPRVIVILPAKNEEGTIENSIANAKQSIYKPEVIVVDAYSTDKTAELAKREGAIVIQQQSKIFPAKGLAMKTGLRGAFERSAEIIVFLDADISNITPEWVDKLVHAITADNCDMSRPMLHTFFPELAHFEQPLSGEVCARKQVWENLLKKDDGSGSIPNG